MALFGLAGRVDGHIKGDLAGLFKDQRQRHRIARLKAFIEAHEHHVVAAALQNKRFPGRNDKALFDVGHLHYALGVLDMGVKLNQLALGRACLDQAVIGIAGVVDQHEGRAGLGHRACAAGIGIHDVDVQGKGRKAKGGDGKRRKQGGFEGHCASPFVVWIQVGNGIAQTRVGGARALKAARAAITISSVGSKGSSAVAVAVRGASGVTVATASNRPSAQSGQICTAPVGLPSASTRTVTGPVPVQSTIVPAGAGAPRATAIVWLVRASRAQRQRFNMGRSGVIIP